ncbi:DUF6152 family protein [Bordetella sp. BOR01]|uniref:DUF6152 family protein n=1 Tax=Bordetella sp. BOR01 TaxID=2854779 RepID=UPI001C4976D7|nr:DUF6152 family protein [Bordetella sp. BOR01]MBV7486580.1 hypothetical protein [Bordetella sp. BOR01]
MSYRSLAANLTGLAAAGLFMASASAHHGWSWADTEQIQLQGTIKQVQIAPPHPWLDVETQEGLWRVELGNPSQTKRSGFVEGSAKPGDSIAATGNRAQDHAEKRMKAVQITVGGKTYDIYPERIKK